MAPAATLTPPAATEKKTLIVARVKDPGHPAGQRIAGGYLFTLKNKAAFVTKKELALIAADQYIFIEGRCSSAWFELFGLEYNETQAAIYKTKNPEKIDPSVMAKDLNAVNKAAKEAQEDGEIDVKGKVVEDESERKSTIEKLVAAGKVPGQDFDAAAPLSVLNALL